MYRTFSRMRSMVIAAVAACIAFCAFAWSSAVPLVWDVMTSADISFAKSMTLLRELLYLSLFEFSAATLLYVVVASLAFGINSALLAFYLRLRRRAPIAGAGGIMGSIVTFFGVGCAACGSATLVSIAGTLGASGLLVSLPYRGEELGYIGILLLCISSVLLARAINKPAVCPI